MNQKIIIWYNGDGDWTTSTNPKLRKMYPYCLYVPEDATDDEIQAKVDSAILDPDNES